jgi:AcrR family transcriptional regulator
VTAPVRPPGRPQDTQLTERFLTAGARFIAKHGVHQLNADRLCAELHAGKAGFYRRWATVDHFLAAIALRLAAEPVAWSEPGSLRKDLAALVLHQVADDRALVSCALLSRLPYSDVLFDAWTSSNGPGGRLLAEVEAVTADTTVLAPWLLFLQRGVQRIVAGQREQVLLHGDPADVQLVLGEVDDLLAAVYRRTAGARSLR